MSEEEKQELGTLEKAEAINRQLEENLKKQEELIKKQEDLAAKQILSGRGVLGDKEPPKVESYREYKERILRNEK